MTCRHKCVLVSVAALLLAASGLQAATFVVGTDRDLVRRSEAAVIATAISSYTQIAEYGGVETVTVFSVEEVLKGRLQPGSISVHAPGGRYGNQVKVLTGLPRYFDGERVLLLLNRTKYGHWAVAQAALGKFSFETDRAGQRLLVREEAELAASFDQDFTPHQEKRRSAERFMEFVRTEGRGGVGIEDYFVAYHPLSVRRESSALLRQQSDALSTSPRSYSLTNPGDTIGFRWATFPASAATLVYSNTGAHTAVITDSITRAMGLWNGECGSNVNLANGGADPGPGAPGGALGSADGRSTIRFEVDLSPAGVTPYVCGGGNQVIGLAGPNAISGTGQFQSEEYGFLTEADVDINVGVRECASYRTSFNFVIGLAHEIGHTIGMRHSDRSRDSSAACVPSAANECSGSAVMNSVVPLGLLALQSWDVNAVRSLYPSPCVRPRDYDASGMTDILLRHNASGSVGAWLMNGTAIAGGGSIGSAPTTLTLAGVGDLNGDGRGDLIWIDPSGGVGVWFLNGFTVSGGGFVGSSAGLTFVASADFNGDGKDDMLWRDGGGGVGMWLMNGSTIASGGFVASAAGLTVEGAADFDGDHRADIFFRDGSGGTGLWRMNGATILSGHFIGSSAGLTVAGVRDFNGDGRADVVFRDGSGGVGMWLMNGSTVASGGLVGSAAGLTVAATGDYNGDGKGDILFTDGSGSLGMWLMNGLTVSSGGSVANASGFTVK